MSSQILMDLSGLLPVAEKRKVLNHFIRKAQENQVNNILDYCKDLPSTQYNLLKLLLADKFRRFDLIVELLYDGDTSIISGATAKSWLYEGENNTFIDCDFLINQLFPNVSYNCRQKVLYRIGRYVKDEKKADEIWEAVEHKYGFHLAFTLLQACSKDKISSILTNRKVDLSGYQLVQILEKFYDIGLKYLKDHLADFAHSSTNSYRSPLVHLYLNHKDDFLDLCLNNPVLCSSNFKFGRGRSTKLIRAYREKLLEKPTATSSLLKRDRIHREFSAEEFQTFFESTLHEVSPANVNNDNLWKWVNMVPKNKRVEMVNEVYKKLFQINMDEQKEYMSPDYIVLLPDEQRVSVVQWKIENDKKYGWCFKDTHVYCYDDDEKKRAWLLLKPSSYSVPELQKLLLIEQDVSKRSSLSGYLIKACYFNDDLPRLLSTLVLLSKRSRNDQGEFRMSIFQSLHSIMDNMEFSKAHWDIIIEMIQAALVMADSRDYSDHEKENLIEKCIAFHLASDLPLGNLVSMYIKLKIKTSSRTWTNAYVKNEADRRKLLELYVKELENLQLTNDLRSHDGDTLEPEELSELIANLIEEICKFNKNATSSSVKLEPILIASHQWLRTNLEKIAKEEEKRLKKKSKSNTSVSWDFAKQLVNIIQALRKEQNISLDAFHDSDTLFSTILRRSPCSSILMYFLGKNPSKLLDNWPITVSKMLKSESGLQFMSNIKTWNYPTLVAQAVKTCSELIDQTLDDESEVTIQQKCNAVSALAVLSEPLDFLSLAEKFYPPEGKVDVFADNSKEEYQIRQAIAKSIVKVKVSHLAFPAIEKYCVGDYLKLAIAALYSHSGRASETKALQFLHEKLINSPVSLQKHIVRLYFAISSVEEKIRAFNEIKSSNVSIRYELFLRASFLLRSSPSQQTWTILKEIIKKTTEEDASIILYLHTKPRLDICPKEYISDYILTCLEMLTKLKAEKVDDFVGHVENVMNMLPEETLEDIIVHKNDSQSFYPSFCVKYLEDSSTESTADHRLANIWILIEKRSRNLWDVKKPRQYDENSFDYPTRKSVFQLISSLTESRLGHAWLKQKICQFLLEKFRAESMTKFFKEILYLDFGLLFVKEVEKSGGERLKSFGQGSARLVDALVEKYGGEIILVLMTAVTDFVNGAFSNELNQNQGVIVELIDGILETSKSRSNQIISISLLKDVNPKSSNLIATLEKVEKFLKDSRDEVVEMYYGSITR